MKTGLDLESEKKMGSFFTKNQETSLLEAPAASGEKSLETKPESPTKKRNELDGRSYKEVVRSGPESNSLSALSEPGAAWKFCQAPENQKVCLQECVQDKVGDREGTGKVRSV